MLTKLFEMCLHTKLSHCGITGMQFGFKKGSGCERGIYIKKLMLLIIFKEAV